MKKALLIIGLYIFSLNGFSQRSDKLPRYFDNPIMIDTTNTLLIPTRYNTDIMSYSKIGLRSNYYANILITPTDNSAARKLFETDTYILPLKLTERNRSYYKNSYSFAKSISTNWIFFLVLNKDLDENQKINEKDPTILYVTDLSANGLRRITAENENVVDYYFYENQNLIIVKIQRDISNDSEFTDLDNDFYFLFLDYDSLEEIKRLNIE